MMGTGCDDLSKNVPFTQVCTCFRADRIRTPGFDARDVTISSGDWVQIYKGPHVPTFYLQPGVSRGAPPQPTPTAKTDPFWNGGSAVPLKW